MSLPLRECGLKYHTQKYSHTAPPVTPFAGVWIEISHSGTSGIPIRVTPFAGVWIEIDFLPPEPIKIAVTPFAGVWIEIDYENFINHFYTVTPFAGVWIEISTKRTLLGGGAMSLPLRECGLKYRIRPGQRCRQSHSLCGSVD